MCPISDYSSELTSTGIDELILYHDTDISAIMTEIRSLRSTPDIDAISDDRVTDIRKMGYRRVSSDIGVFYLDERAYLRILTDTCCSSDICVGSDGTSFSKIDISLYIGSRFEDDSLFEDSPTDFSYHRAMHITSMLRLDDTTAHENSAQSSQPQAER